MEKPEKIRVGIVGLGYAGQEIHGISLRELKEYFEIVSGYDVNESRAAEVCGRWKITPAANFKEIITAENVDLVVITTKPFESHVEQALAVLEAGKHAVVDKPVAMNYAGAARLAKAAGRYPGKLFPHQNQRWNLAYLTFCEAIEAGVVGNVRYIEMRKNFGADVGGAIYDYGPHWVDMAVAISRKRKLCEVSASVLNPSGADLPDRRVGFFNAILRYTDGLIISIGFFPDGGSDVQYWYAAGDKGGYRQEWFDIPADLFRKQSRQTTGSETPRFVPERYRMIDRKNKDAVLSDSTTSLGFYQNVAAVLLNKAKQNVTVDDILEQFKIIDAILESGRQNRTVKFE